jgi:predicted PurR-regulated permease PerM
MTDEAGPPTPRPQDIARVTLGVTCLVAMIVGTLWILRPFLGAMIWAVTIVVATWPLLAMLEARLGGRRALPATVMTVVLLLVFVLPFTLAIVVVVAHVDPIVTWVTGLSSMSLPLPPAWVERIPLVGGTLAQHWREIAAKPALIADGLAPYARTMVGWFVGLLGSIALLAVELLLITGIAAYLYARGEGAAEFAQRFAYRLAGPRGDRAVALAGASIRGIAMGVVVTALIQGVLAGLGLAVTGVPFAAVLTVVCVFLAIAQIGVLPVLACAVAWMYWTGSPAWATGLLVWTLFVVSIDNVLRPILIRRGADLPLPLIFAGVLGGIFGFGIVGIFIGPVVLGVTYTLLLDWVKGGEAAAAPGQGAQA